MMNSRIGFMQGRLSPLVDGKIQAFPSDHWQDELIIAGENGISCLEWTLDHDGLYDNPLMTSEGQETIRSLLQASGVKIVSLTGDIFMQQPFWKAAGCLRQELIAEFDVVCQRCALIGISYVVVPLVDNGSLTSVAQEEILIKTLLEWSRDRQPDNLTILFESDYGPEKLARFISKLPVNRFGINYDTGNSASLGFDADDEITAYGQRVLNVHIKDRQLNGGTVPLGEGDAKLDKQIHLLERSGYEGHYILQTARADDDQHLRAILHYRELVKDWIMMAGNDGA